MLIKELQAESGLVFNSEGQVLDSYNVSNENNVSAMAGVIATMSNEFLKDTMGAKSLKIISLASDSGLVILNKISKDEYICLMTKDPSKAAFMELTLRKLVSK